jgi:hypothetical protein
VSRHFSIATLCIVIAILAFGIMDVSFVDPGEGPLPEIVIKICGVILSGVAVGMILFGMQIHKRNGGQDPPSPATHERVDIREEDHEHE